LVGQKCGFLRFLAIFMSMVVYQNLLFSAVAGKAGGKDKITKVGRANILPMLIVK